MFKNMGTFKTPILLWAQGYDFANKYLYLTKTDEAFFKRKTWLP